MCPPGLGFASVNQRALDYAAEQPAGRYFFDWNKTAKSQRKGDSPFTPAVGLFLGLDVALDMIERGGHRGRLRPPRAARPRHPRRRRRARARAVRRPGRALERRHGGRAAGVDRRRQGPGRAAQARHHRQRRPEPAQGQDHPDRPLRLLRRVRHPDVAVGPGDGAATSSATRSSTGPASAPPSGCSSKPASRPPRERPHRAVQGPRQGEARRLRRGPPARALRRRPRRRLDRRGARRSASATTTRS